MARNTARKTAEKKRQSQAQDKPMRLAKRIKVEPVTEQPMQPPAVSRLPAELWDRISSYLPLSSQGALSLTSRASHNRNVLDELRDAEPRNPQKEKGKFRAIVKFGRLPNHIWVRILDCGNYVDRISLMTSCSYLHNWVGRGSNVLAMLKRPSYSDTRMKALFRMPELFSGRTLCLECVAYHPTQSFMPEEEQLDDFSESDDGVLLLGDRYYHWIELRDTLIDRKIRTFVPDLQEPTRSEWNETVRFKLDTCTDHWIAEVLYTRPLTVPLLQDCSKIELPMLCDYHEYDSPSLFQEVQNIIKNHPRPWDRTARLGPEDEYRGAITRCAYCPTEFTVRKVYIGEKVLGRPIPGRSQQELTALRRATHQIVISRAMDLGSLYTPHSREWQALTKDYKGTYIETKPFRIFRDSRRDSNKPPETIPERTQYGRDHTWRRSNNDVEALDGGVLVNRPELCKK